MQDLLTIQLTEQQDTINWLLINQGHRQPDQSGSWEDLKSYLENEGSTEPKVALIIPIEKSVFLEMVLPPGQAKYAAKAIDFAVEEKLSQDPSLYHLVPRGKPKQGSLSVIAIDKEWFATQLQILKEAGLEVVQCFIDAEILVEAGAIHVIQTDRSMVVSSPSHCLSADVSWLGALLPKAMEQHEDKPLKLTLPENSEQENIIKAQVMLSADQELTTEYYTGTYLGFLVDKLLSSHPAHSLLIGEFGGKKEQSQWLNALKPAAIAATVLLVAGLSFQVVQGWQAARLSEAYLQANEKLCKDIFGPQKRCRENLIKREVQNLISQPTTTTSAASFLSLLEDFASIKGQETLISLRYTQDKQELLMVILDQDFQKLEQIKSKLEGKGYNVELSASQDKNMTRGNFRITGKVSS
ncbi:type II secretion system protein GspL [Gynuella sunshinyii]|uniref:Type II secretion system protein L n=1 Tax=Gynuella sunshinyii YC6258 TaxID=1445510 RepID=A0A0C5VZL6_9GAMM|nr:type II secretion system protein GspL [Gynuella sunshinyii]AJQ95869.1 type II secretory pathway, component PulL [Gynuella sunshinyii YC6258]